MHTRMHTHVHTDTHSETYLHLQPGQQRSRDATSAPTPAPGRKQTALPTQTQKLRPRPCHTAPAHAHQENRGNTGRDAHTEANTRVRGSMLSRQNTWNREGSAMHTVPPGAGHGNGMDVRHSTAPSSEKTWERHRPCNTRVRTHTLTHTHPAGSQEDPQHSVHYTSGGGHGTMLLNLSVLEVAPHCEPRARS